MVIKYGNNTIDKLAMDSPVKKMYYGGNLVYIGFAEEESTPMMLEAFDLNGTRILALPCDESKNTITSAMTKDILNVDATVKFGDCVTYLNNTFWSDRDTHDGRPYKINGKVVLPPNITSGNNAFVVSKITSLEVKADVFNFGNSFCSDCTSLTSVTANYVSEIDYNSFVYCTSLRQFTYSGFHISYNNDISIGRQAFAETPLETFDVKTNSTRKGINANVFCTINYNAFYNCTNLTSVTFDDTIFRIDVYSEVFGNTKISSFNFPNKTLGIYDAAFINLTTLTDVRGNIHTIGESAFKGCTNLTSVTIDSSFMELGREYSYSTSIYNYAFSGCTNLTSLHIPSLLSVSKYAFSGSSIQNVTIDALSYNGQTINFNQYENGEMIDFSEYNGTVTTDDCNLIGILLLQDFPTERIITNHDYSLNTVENNNTVCVGNDLYYEDKLVLSCDGNETILGTTTTKIAEQDSEECLNVSYEYSSYNIYSTNGSSLNNHSLSDGGITITTEGRNGMRIQGNEAYCSGETSGSSANYTISLDNGQSFTSITIVARTESQNNYIYNALNDSNYEKTSGTIRMTYCQNRTITRGWTKLTWSEGVTELVIQRPSKFIITNIGINVGDTWVDTLSVESS